MSSVTDDQLREAMSGSMRDQILDEIFKRMEEHFRADAAGDTEAIIHWRIGGGPDDTADEFETVIKGGACKVLRGFESEGARVTLSMDGEDFLRLVTNNVPGPQLFMSGKLKIEGDMMFAATAASLFTIPGTSPS
ncbi:MAG TPA: SCP2 sterol-binding domain-containing protein [Solirubrobacterales bacterium]|nr:SCP2 sterol-binding domain-containing protein [Solirubrobacterales bacterium]